MSTTETLTPAAALTPKPRKPYPSFPLSAHANGQWYKTKRIGGKQVFFYFGEWKGDPAGARAHAAYLAVADEIRHGRQPAPTVPPESVTAGDVVGRYLEAQEARVRRREIGLREFDDVRRAVLFDFLDGVGEATPLQDVGRFIAGESTRPLDRFRELLASRVGTLTFNKRLGKVRRMLRWAAKVKLLAAPLHEDEALVGRSKRTVRRDRREREERDGKPIFTPAECRALVTAAANDGGPLFAFILLALNAGMGQSHIADLPMAAGVVDEDAAFIDWVRTKTEELFQAPLWPITAAAVRRLRARRPAPRPEASALLFVTKYGNPWVRELAADDARGAIGDVNPDDAIGKAFDKLQRRLNMKRTGRGFYALRRTFGTIANAVQDKDAIRRVMGHGLQGMDPHYVREIPRGRLQAVVDHVGRELLGDGVNGLTNVELVAAGGER